MSIVGRYSLYRAPYKPAYKPLNCHMRVLPILLFLSEFIMVDRTVLTAAASVSSPYLLIVVHVNEL